MGERTGTLCSLEPGTSLPQQAPSYAGVLCWSRRTCWPVHISMRSVLTIPLRSRRLNRRRPSQRARRTATCDLTARSVSAVSLVLIENALDHVEHFIQVTGGLGERRGATLRSGCRFMYGVDLRLQ